MIQNKMLLILIFMKVSKMLLKLLMLLKAVVKHIQKTLEE